MGNGSSVLDGGVGEGGGREEVSEKERERERLCPSHYLSAHTHTWGSSKALSCDSCECEFPVVVERDRNRKG